jgi:hypothetical protein
VIQTFKQTVKKGSTRFKLLERGLDSNFEFSLTSCATRFLSRRLVLISQAQQHILCGKRVFRFTTKTPIKLFDLESHELSFAMPGANSNTNEGGNSVGVESRNTSDKLTFECQWLKGSEVSNDVRTLVEIDIMPYCVAEMDLLERMNESPKLSVS